MSYVIFSSNETARNGSPQFWSSKDGWGELENADVFTGDNVLATMNLPIAGEWMKLLGADKDHTELTEGLALLLSIAEAAKFIHHNRASFRNGDPTVDAVIKSLGEKLQAYEDLWEKA